MSGKTPASSNTRWWIISPSRDENKKYLKPPPRKKTPAQYNASNPPKWVRLGKWIALYRRKKHSCRQLHNHHERAGMKQPRIYTPKKLTKWQWKNNHINHQWKDVWNRYLTVSPMKILVAEWWDQKLMAGQSLSSLKLERFFELPAAAKVDGKKTVGSPSGGVPAYHTVCWWFRNPARKPVEVGTVVFPMIYKGFF